MTEIGHGSNVRDIETVAVYDPAAQEFDLHSPTFTSGKNYIGNAGVHGRIATVFAQLETRGERHGVHAFVVPIRDEEGKPLPGVRLEDNGEKLGLNGVDNGRIWFDHVRVPRVELLDRFAQVAADGGYASGITNPAARFFTTLGTLVGGRVSVGHSGLSIAKSGLGHRGALRRAAAAVRPGGGSARKHPPRLPRAPAAADAASGQRVRAGLRVQATDQARADDRPGNRIGRSRPTAAGLKSFSTWNTTHTLQTGREACGGEGYLAINRFAALKADSDIFTTFEGDNTVLMQLVAKNLLTDYAAQFKGKTKGQLLRWAVGQKLRGVVRRRGRVDGRPADGSDAGGVFPRARGAHADRGRRTFAAADGGWAEHGLRGVYFPAERTARAGERARRTLRVGRVYGGSSRLPGRESAAPC